MKKYNIIMLLLDGSRSDMLHVSPDLVRITKSGSFFDQMIISSPYTVASIHSIFTGLLGKNNGVDSYYNMFGLKEDVKTMAEYLHQHGYYTHGDIMSEAVIVDRGFDELNIHDEHSVNMLSHHKEIINKAVKKNNPFFLFLQYSKIHTDSITKIAKKFDDMDEKYFTDEQKKINKHNFANSMIQAGEYSRKIMDFLENLEILDDTIIIFFSDHGTSLGERLGEKMYGSFTYDYTIKTYAAFINKNLFPERTINHQVRSIDIMPTVLEVLGISHDPTSLKLDGDSLLEYITDSKVSFFKNIFSKKNQDRIAYVETGGLKGLWPSPDKPNVMCLRTPSYKIIYNATPKTWEFYNLGKDPVEENNLINAGIPECKVLQDKLLQIINE